jgi:8-oxo-dGTP pyrophosphatase MutT (NUDIX family)
MSVHTRALGSAGCLVYGDRILGEAARVDVVELVAAHVLVIDPEERVLLMHGPGIGPAGYWVLPGGGVDPGETPLEVAIREVREETGLRLSETEVSGPIGSGLVDFSLGDVTYRQHQHYFAAWVGGLDAVTTCIDDFDPHEDGAERDSRGVLSFNWWSLDQVRSHLTSGDVLAPRDLAEILASHLGR